jgi:hypothetical protein
MFIKKSRILSIEELKQFEGKTLQVVIPISPEILEDCGRIGFSAQLSIGDTLLPAKIGPVSKRNAEGNFVRHKDQPKETHYRTVEWTWKQFKGRDDYEEVSDFKDVPYQRYPRTFVPPYAVELSVVALADGVRFVVAPQITLDLEKNIDLLKHTINLFLEIFGECEIRYENLESIIKAKIVRLNWNILPPGEYPWQTRKEQVREFLDRASNRNKVVVSKRLEIINQYGPDFVAIGLHGFSGYMVFGFDKKKIYVFESTHVNNATYIFDKNWKDLSQLTKKEILSEDRQKDRVIHLHKSWMHRIDQILRK